MDELIRIELIRNKEEKLIMYMIVKGIYIY